MRGRRNGTADYHGGGGICRTDRGTRTGLVDGWRRGRYSRRRAVRPAARPIRSERANDHILVTTGPTAAITAVTVTTGSTAARDPRPVDRLPGDARHHVLPPRRRRIDRVAPAARSSRLVRVRDNLRENITIAVRRRRCRAAGLFRLIRETVLPHILYGISRRLISSWFKPVGEDIGVYHCSGHQMPVHGPHPAHEQILSRQGKKK